MQNYYQQPPVNSYLEQYQATLYYREKRRRERNTLIGIGFLLGGVLIAYLFIQTVIVLMLQRSKYYSVYETSAAFQNCFNMVAIHFSSLLIPYVIFAAIRKKDFEGRPLIPMNKIGALQTAAWVSFGMGCCVLGNLAVSFIMKVTEALGYKLTQPEMLKTDSPLAAVTLVVSVAVVPAIFEEFAYRCCILGVLQKYGKAFGVVAVSIVFGLTHGNVIQFIYAFLLGLALGYITVRTQSVVPAMLIHGFANGLSVVQEILTYTSGEKTGEYAAGALFIVWGIAAIAGTVYLFVKKLLFPEKTPKTYEPYALSLGRKLLCLAPGLFIPFVILIIMTAQFVEKVQ
ncbi:MAG: CPBP family intramembrane metalloprotease [Eubacterium sp.]|nr:CPBP family intramembrane metalloprotease [Eubacterium sp.]